MYPSTQNLAAFVAVAKLQKFKSASRQLNLTESAISHQISRLEDELGVRLFERSRKGAILTRAGEMFYHHIDKALLEIEMGVSTVKQRRSNLVSISAPRTFAAMWLAPKISDFSNRHPELELQIMATDRICDLHREGIDVAFRATRDTWGEYGQTHFCCQKISPVASPDLVKGIQEIGWAQALDEIPFILNETHPDEWDIWAEISGKKLPANKGYKRLPSYDLVQAAAVGGFGIAMSRTPLDDDTRSEGRLVDIFPKHGVQTTPYDLIYIKDHRTRTAIKTFMDWAVGIVQE